MQLGYTYKEEEEYYSVTIRSNSVRELKARINMNSEIVSVNHRSMRWMAASLVSANSPNSYTHVPDCAYYVNSDLPVSAKIMDKILKGGKMFDSVENNKIHLGKNFSGRVAVVRHHKAKYFSKSTPFGEILANVAEIRATSDLTFLDPHVELDLHFPTPRFDPSYIHAFWTEGLSVLSILRKHVREGEDL